MLDVVGPVEFRSLAHTCRFYVNARGSCVKSVKYSICFGTGSRGEELP
jgi:hypothetical protein